MTRKAKTDTRRHHKFVVDLHLSARLTHRDAAKALANVLSWLDLGAHPAFSHPGSARPDDDIYANRLTMRGVRGRSDVALALEALDSATHYNVAERELFNAVTAPARAILEELL